MNFSAHIFALISTYGYLAVFLGAIVEGETIILLAGLLAYDNHLSFPLIILFAFLGTLASDLGWFFLGRHRGHKFVNRFDWVRRVVKKPLQLVHKRPAVTAFFMRFMYGVRHIIPFGIGMSNITFKKFFLWNTFGAFVWVLVYATLGFLIGSALESFLGKLRQYELRILLFVGIIFVVAHVIVKIVKYIIYKYGSEEE